MRKLYKFELLFPLAITLVVLVIVVAFIRSQPNTSFMITNVEEVGLVQNPESPTLIRDGGSGAIVGDKYLWTFGDTLFNPKSVDGVNGRTATAGFAPLSEPLQVSEPLDTNKAPNQFIPLSASDQAYNGKTKKGDDRYAIWPGLVVPRPIEKDALVYFLRLKVNPGGGGLNYDLLNTGIARVAEGSLKAEILVEKLFTAPENLYNGPGFVKDNYAYFYECPNSSSNKCSLARVNINDALNKNKYTFWDGSSWQNDIKKVAAKFPGTSTGASLGYVQSKKQYVVFYNQPFSKNMYYVISDKLTGPWSNATKFYSANANNYALTYHPELTDSSGRLLLTYYQPKSGMHAIKVTVQ